jgi:EmrB/QacA subfamily drug resistance transporter
MSSSAQETDLRVYTSDPRKLKIGLLLCCTSIFLVNLNNTNVNLALADIKRSLHPSVTTLQWVIDAYLLVLSSMMIFSGALGDRVGRRKVFRIGFTIFALGSLLSCLSPNVASLIGFRVLQAIGASMLSPIGMSLINDMFQEPVAKIRAFAVWGTAVGAGLACGPLIGGPIVEYLGWRSVFWINIPIALGVALIVPAYIPESKHELGKRLDIRGQLLILLAIASTIYAVIEFPESGFTPSTLGAAGLAIVAISTFLYAERHHTSPLIDLQQFKSRPFSCATLIAVAGYVSIGGFMFLHTLYLQCSLGFSPLKAGLLMAPMALAAAISAKCSARFIERYGYPPAIVIAGFALIVSFILSISVSYHFNMILLLAAFVLFGIGFGGANTPINTMAMLGAQQTGSAMAGAMISTSRQLGQTLGVALIGSCFVLVLGDKTLSESFGVASLLAWAILVSMGVTIVICGYLTSNFAVARLVQHDC